MSEHKLHIRSAKLNVERPNDIDIILATLGTTLGLFIKTLDNIPG